MKNIKKIVAMMLVAVLALSLTVCSGKMTAKKLIDKIVEASEVTRMTEGTTAMQIEMAYSANGMDFNISTAMLVETKTSYEPYASYTKMETAMNFGGELETGMGGLGGLEDLFSAVGMGDMNIVDIKIPTTFYVDAETYMPVKVEMDVNGLGAVLSAAMAESLSNGMTVNVSKVAAVYDNIGYGEVEVPAIPEEVYNIDFGAEK